jgi:arylsulfatase A-like enzyme
MRIGLRVFQVFTSLLAMSAWCAVAAPNVNFVLSDDLGHGDMGVFFQNLRKTNNVRSEPWHMTPHLDSLASSGIRLQRHYCPAPVCAPSRASFLLGVHQGHANVRDNQFDKALENNHTLATVLKGAGYATAAIGKYGLQGGGGSPSAWPAYPTKRGFDYYFGYVRHGDGHEHYPKEGLYRGTKECYDGDTNITPSLDRCYTTDLFTARAKRWIAEHHAKNPNQPFFVYLAFDTPHAVLELPTQAYPSGGGTNGGLQWIGTPGNMINTAAGTIDSYYHPDYAAATWDDDSNASTPEVAWPDVYKRYATSVRRIDDCVGDLRLLLQQLKIETNTLVVFTTDNGPSKESYLSEGYDPTFFNSFGPHDGIKRDTWEGGIRVGALATWPTRIPPNHASQLACGAWDWMPTFAELAGVPSPARSDGVSLLPTLTGNGSQRTPLVYVEYYEGGSTPSYAEFDASHRGRSRRQMQVLFEGNYKGIRYNTTSAATDFEIYDMTSDPKETNNLATQPSFASMQQLLKDRVLRIRRPDSTAARPYDSALVPAFASGSFTNGVLEYATYEGSWPWVPEFASMSAVSTGQVAGIDLSVRTRDDNFGIAFSGFITIPESGDYSFYVQSDSGAHFRIHEATVLDDDFSRTGAEVSGTIRLGAGRHPFRLYYRHTIGTRVLEFKYSGPGIPKQPVPASAFAIEGPTDSRPTAFNDQATTSQATPVLIPVFANDADDGAPAPLTLASITQPAGGTAVIEGTQARYTPNPTFLGEDFFSYAAWDGLHFATGYVTVKVCVSDGTVWFPLNEGHGRAITDASGQVTGSLEGFADEESAWAAGRHGSALVFSGSEHVSVTGGYVAPSGISPRTTAAWIRTTDTGSIIAWGPNNTSRKWHMRIESATANTGALRTEIGGGYARGTTDLRDGQWHHVCTVLPTLAQPNATDLLLYVDGKLEPLSATTASPINTDTAAPTIGVDSQNRHFVGTVDEVRIFNRALSASEVQALYSATNQLAAPWHYRYFGNAPVDWLAQDDGDSCPRLLEYAMGAQPHISDRSRMSLAARNVQGNLALSFSRRTNGTHDLAYDLQSSTNLFNWHAFPGTQTAGEPDLMPGFRADASK